MELPGSGRQGCKSRKVEVLVGLPQLPPMGRLPRIAPQRDFVRRVLRDRRYSLRSGLLSLFATQVSPTEAWTGNGAGLCSGVKVTAALVRGETAAAAIRT